MKQEVQKYDIRQRNAGYITFFISGICAISCGIVVSLLQEQIGFSYAMTGTLLSLMSIGNLLAGFASGVLPGRIGMKWTVMVLSAGFAAGYFIMAATPWAALLIPAFLLVGIGKGCVLNTCTILVGNNTENRTKGMNLMHSCYALGALLCPFVVAGAAVVSGRLPMLLIGICGAVLWVIFVMLPMGESQKKREEKTDWSFLKMKKFWILTGLLFCQNAAETSVTGWMVTYYKGSGILSGAISTYTVTVMWLATLVARLLIAFVFPIRRAGAAMVKMGIGCTIFYFAMMQARGPVSAILLLFAFAFSMAGMNPTAVASAGRMTTVTSMGVMLPVASSGAILMPWIIGIVAERVSIRAGMACDIIPCIGMLLLGVAVKKLETASAE